LRPKINSLKSQEAFFQIWKQIESNPKTDSLEDNFLLDQYALQNNQFINIYSLKQHKVLYMSQNLAEVLGYQTTKKEYEKRAAYYWLRDLSFQQSSFFLKFSYFYLKKIRKHLRADGGTIHFYLHNFKLKQPNNQVRHLGLSCTSLELDAENNLDKILISNIDMGSQIKDPNTWWMDLQYNLQQHSYYCEDKEIKPKPFFTKRETDILKLVEKGLKNKEIASELGISAATIEKHRNNMLAYSGAKDLSSLLEIAKLAPSYVFAS
jgi:DNA-binding CsgD family transcriptional regulator